MWDHNGTYMEGFGFQYKDQKIQVELTRMDELAGETLLCPPVLGACIGGSPLLGLRVCWSKQYGWQSCMLHACLTALI